MFRWLRAAMAAASLVLTASAWAGDFAVSPVRLDLGGSVRSGVITVYNSASTEKTFRIEALAWRQGADGAEAYDSAPELVYQPRFLRLKAGEQGIVRIGTRQGLVAVEKSYRLFVEEQADTRPGDTAQVSFLIRFGVPVFVRPLKLERKLEMEKLAVEGGRIQIDLRNSGTQHERIEQMRVLGFDAHGTEIFSGKLADRYLLAGQLRQASLELPPDVCKRLSRLAIELQAQKNELLKSADVPAPACS